MAIDYFVKTDQFEGPLDLLLHLIKVHEIDIFAIDIFTLTGEYLEYLRLMRFDDLKQAGEFLEMAATLIEIKARMLLPHDEVTQANDDDGDDDDPVKSLQERLIQYDMFRNAAEHFSQMPQMGVEIQTNNEWKRLEPLYEDIESPLSGDPATLVVLYEQMLRQLAERKNAKVVKTTHRITVEETIEKLAEEIDSSKFTLFQGLYNRLQSRDELVCYTLATLELVKLRRIKVYQQDLFGPVWLYRADCDESILPLRSEEPLPWDKENEGGLAPDEIRDALDGPKSDGQPSDASVGEQQSAVHAPEQGPPQSLESNPASAPEGHDPEVPEGLPADDPDSPDIVES